MDELERIRQQKMDLAQREFEILGEKLTEALRGGKWVATQYHPSYGGSEVEDLEVLEWFEELKLSFGEDTGGVDTFTIGEQKFTMEGDRAEGAHEYLDALLEDEPYAKLVLWYEDASGEVQKIEHEVDW